MADRRMFSKFVTDSDIFLDMPLTAQALYFHLGMSGDDDGFVASPKKVQRSVGCSADDLKVLIAKGFVIPFDSGVIVLTHWNIHNALRKDRKKDTIFTAERNQLSISDNGLYFLTDNQLSTNCQPNDNQTTTNCPHSIGEYSIGKDNIGEGKNEPDGSKPTRHKYGKYNNVLLSDDEITELKEEMPNYVEYIQRLSEYMASSGKSYKLHIATIRRWAKEDKIKNNTVSSERDYDADFKYD